MILEEKKAEDVGADLLAVEISTLVVGRRGALGNWRGRSSPRWSLTPDG
jgi:hypothetical protein